LRRVEYLQPRTNLKAIERQLSCEVIVEIRGRLGDEVKKDHVLLCVRSDDISGGFANYQRAVVDEVLAEAQWERPRSFTRMARLLSMTFRLRMTRNRKPELR
jgi:hypothetical protein